MFLAISVGQIEVQLFIFYLLLRYSAPLQTCILDNRFPYCHAFIQKTCLTLTCLGTTLVRGAKIGCFSEGFMLDLWFCIVSLMGIVFIISLMHLWHVYELVLSCRTVERFLISDTSHLSVSLGIILLMQASLPSLQCFF